MSVKQLKIKIMNKQVLQFCPQQLHFAITPKGVGLTMPVSKADRKFLLWFLGLALLAVAIGLAIRYSK